MKVCKFTEEYLGLVDGFTCGNIILDTFIKSRDALDDTIGTTYIMLSDDSNWLIGYYNITVSRVDSEYCVNGNPYRELMGGAFHINYLCIREDFQHKLQLVHDDKNIYLGDLLLMSCEDLILETTDKIGAMFITLYSTDNGYKLYTRNDYLDFEDDMNTVTNETDGICKKMYKCIYDIKY